MFTLHPRLAADTHFITESALSRILLMNNALFPWLVLVPRRKEACEIMDLNDADRHLLIDEITFASRVLRKCFAPYKLNIAALGNQVSMLHIHVIARFTTDSAWPHPVWGSMGQPYADSSPLIQIVRDFYVNNGLDPDLERF